MNLSLTKDNGMTYGFYMDADFMILFFDHHTLAIPESVILRGGAAIISHPFILKFFQKDDPV